MSKTRKCPHCQATESKIQPASGFHCWPIVYDCGYRETWCAGSTKAEDVEANCPFQTYEGYTPIHIYAEAHSIELPKKDKTLNYSDLFVDVYTKLSDRILHKWESVESDGSICNHMMWHYKDTDLEEYFKSDDYFKIISLK
jgi:hypothetical protein